MFVFQFVEKVLYASFELLKGASVWLVISFILAGILHNILSPEKLQASLGNKKFSSLVKAALSGFLLPICSCGVIPLGLGLYYSGAYLGPTLAFICATPIINPAAVLLAYGLLGPQIATIYLLCGLLIPIGIGFLGNLWAGNELKAPGIEEQEVRVSLESGEKISLKQKIITGVQWGFLDLGAMVSKWVIIGMLLAGFITAVVPPQFIKGYLGDPGIISIGGIALLGAIMYVCAVGHIPFVAALVASGAAPGIAITFLMTGAATNLPELLSIGKMIGKRTVFIYSLSMVLFSLAAGYIANLLLLPDFVPFFDLSKGQEAVNLANKLIFSSAPWMQYTCAFLVIGLALYHYWPRIKVLWVQEETA
ncbi:hypothetical protein SAMN02745221_00178 [Thermosyntropha lipolytica DSM 11003]|uniref:Permease n=1 Tax=Thermosyntropha lipolytica DSM 11003 TaxID=1123382 RepID=A0A1M5JPW1_9FIRM|nr:efflux transporter SaoE [Thermosyntropha lipolytica]SHG42594.1 hypothetical protein SAMN02745221_00178 [Thermosyntropha lipolytica DSM 11003]